MDKGYSIALSITKKARPFVSLSFAGFLLFCGAAEATEAPTMKSPKCGESTSYVFREITASGKSRYLEDTAKDAETATKRECTTALQNTANLTAGTNRCNNEDCLFDSCRSCTLTRKTLVEKDTTKFSNLKVEAFTPKPRSSGNQLGDTVSLFALLFGSSKEQFQATVSCAADVRLKDSCDGCSFWFGDDIGLIRSASRENPLLNPASSQGGECLALAEESSSIID